MKHLIYSLALLLLVSCSVQKRHYRKGFYFAGTNTKQQKLPNRERDAATANALVKSVSPVLEQEKSNALIVKSSAQHPIPTDSCDVLVFRDGSEIIARITEVSEDKVRYKRCDNIDGPTYVTEKADLFMLKYSNGTRETMKAPAPKTTIINPAPAKTNGTPNDRQEMYDEPSSANFSMYSGISALLTLLLSIAAPYLLILSLISAIKAVASAKRYFSLTSKEPYLYPGRAKAITGMVLGIITLAILLVAILVVILLLMTI